LEEERIRKLFDVISAKFDNKDQTFTDHYEQMTIVCRTCFDKREIEGKRILDAGCGTGTACVYFARNKSRETIGVDISPGSLELGRRWGDRFFLSNIAFQKASLLNLPFKNASFDIVFSCGAIPYVLDPKAAINELIRVTKEEGTLLFFLLKKNRMDGVYETARSVLSKLPINFVNTAAKALAVSIRPVASLFLKRKINTRKGKLLEQTILENLFSPVRLSKVDPNEICDYIQKKGFYVEEISGINGVDFYSSETIFICKAKGLKKKI